MIRTRMVHWRNGVHPDRGDRCNGHTEAALDESKQMSALGLPRIQHQTLNQVAGLNGDHSYLTSINSATRAAAVSHTYVHLFENCRAR